MCAVIKPSLFCSNDWIHWIHWFHGHCQFTHKKRRIHKVTCSFMYRTEMALQMRKLIFLSFFAHLSRAVLFLCMWLWIKLFCEDIDVGMLENCMCIGTWTPQSIPKSPLSVSHWINWKNCWMGLKDFRSVVLWRFCWEMSWWFFYCS